MDETFHQFKSLPPEVWVSIWKLALPGPRVLHLTLENIKICEFGHPSVRSYQPMPCNCRTCTHEDVEVKIVSQTNRTPDLAEELNNEHNGNSSTDVSEIEIYTGNETDWAIDYDDGVSICDVIPFRRPRSQRLQGFRTRCPIPTILLVCIESRQVAAKFYTQDFPTLGVPPTIWFNYAHDTVYLSGETFVHTSADTLMECFDHINPADIGQIENLAIFQEKIDDWSHNYDLQFRMIMAKFPGLKNYAAISKHSIHSVWEKDLTEDQKWGLALVPPVYAKVAAQFYSSNKPGNVPLSGFCIKTANDEHLASYCRNSWERKGLANGDSYEEELAGTAAQHQITSGLAAANVGRVFP